MCIWLLVWQGFISLCVRDVDDFYGPVWIHWDAPGREGRITAVDLSTDPAKVGVGIVKHKPIKYQIKTRSIYNNNDYRCMLRRTITTHTLFSVLPWHMQHKYACTYYRTFAEELRDGSLSLIIANTGIAMVRAGRNTQVRHSEMPPCLMTMHRTCHLIAEPETHEDVPCVVCGIKGPRIGGPAFQMQPVGTCPVCELEFHLSCSTMVDRSTKEFLLKRLVKSTTTAYGGARDHHKVYTPFVGPDVMEHPHLCVLCCRALSLAPRAPRAARARA